ncbi:MAG: hypothetical protein U0670_19535 [Anaerolineae bacterium]
MRLLNLLSLYALTVAISLLKSRRAMRFSKGKRATGSSLKITPP